MPRKTPAAARELGVTVYRLHSLIRGGKLPPPQKDTSGDFIWTDADLDRALQALTLDRRRRHAVPAAAEEGVCRAV
jgi:hypothetical protein